MKCLIELDALEMREIKRIGRKARRFIARNKGQKKAIFPVDLGDHPACLNIDNENQRSTN